MTILLCLLLAYGFSTSHPLTVWVGPLEEEGAEVHTPIDYQPVTFTATAQWGEVSLQARDLYSTPLPVVGVRCTGHVVGAHVDYVDVDAGPGRTARFHHGLGRMYPPRGAVVIGHGRASPGRVDCTALTAMRP